jgi:SARP family transcriptional regulator, regulator of embCAB operon
MTKLVSRLIQLQARRKPTESASSAESAPRPAPVEEVAGVDDDVAGPTRFLVLGPLSLADDSGSVVLQPSKPATLLATLLLHPGEMVSVEFLQRRIWGEEQPGTAKAALQTCVLRLRRLFGRYGLSADLIEAIPGGYRITADPELLDLTCFRDLVARAGEAADPAEELRLLRTALALWRGPALPNVQSELLHREEVPRLHEERLRIVERVFDLELAAGRCRQVLAELRAVAEANPFHERFWEQLIEALHRTGRRADALAEHQRISRQLRDQLGVDPGSGLRRLQQRMLHDDLAGPVGPVDEPGPVESGPEILRGLVDAGLLTEAGAGSYRVHELLRTFTRGAAAGRAVEPVLAGTEVA